MNIYLDNNSTTKPDPEILNVLSSVAENLWGNPSSIHKLGQSAKTTLTKARREIANLLGVKPLEVFFTSSATEASNQMLKGFFEDYSGHLITSDVEHPCVFSVAHYLQDKGVEVTFLKAGEKGHVSAEQVAAVLTPRTKLVALMAVNNETGVKTDIFSIANMLEVEKIPFFVDGVAWIGKEDVQLPRGVSACSFSAHKFHGPKGIAGVVIKGNISNTPLIHGGPQEFNKRGGTENLPATVAMAAALKQTYELKSWNEINRKRQLLESLLVETCAPVIFVGSGEKVCNTTCASFADVDGESLIMSLDLQGVFVSHGSACSSGSLEPSRVLLNMGLNKAQARGTIRISLSRYTTEEEIRKAVHIISETVVGLRTFA